MDPVKPYNTAGSKKEQVGRMFDNIAPTYDLLNRLLSLGIDKGWRRRAVAKLLADNPRFLLDVATGTADVALEMARQLKPDHITGIDIAPQMLEIGREKIHKQALNHVIDLQTGDSENLTFPDNHFDAVTVSFGVRNFENLAQGLSEMRRVLRPGGMLVVLEFSKPHIFPLRQLFNLYFKYVLPLIGRFTSRDGRAYAYLFESVQAFPEGNDFLDILHQTGYQHPQCERLTLGIASLYTARK